MPEMRPPPPTGTITESKSSIWFAISSPHVPCPAIMSGSLKGWTSVAPVLLTISLAFASRSVVYFPYLIASAPYSMMVLTFSCTAVSGNITVHFFPRSRELYATAIPWFPDETATIFLDENWEILWYAPRILKTGMGWKHSSFKYTLRPNLFERDGDSTTGVLVATPSIRLLAATTSASVGKRPWIMKRSDSTSLS